jgi:signal transduction histidine kinase
MTFRHPHVVMKKCHSREYLLVLTTLRGLTHPFAALRTAKSAKLMQTRTDCSRKVEGPRVRGALVFFAVVISFQAIGQRSATEFSIQSKTFLEQKKYKEALIYADSAVLFAKQLDNPDTLAQSYRWRSGVRSAMQDYKNALEDYMFSEEYSARSKSNETAKRDRQLSGELLVEQEAHRKDNIVFNARINDILQTTEREQRNLLMAAASLLVLTVLAVYLFLRKKSELSNFTEQASEEVKELRLSRDRILTALSARLGELRLMVEDLNQSFVLGNASSIDRQSAVASTAAVKKSIDDIVGWVSANQGVSIFNPLIFDCKELTESTLRKFERQIAEKKIKSEVFMSEGQLVFADKQMIASVLENLISNAIKFTPAGGSMSCFSGISNDIVSIGIKDSGVGMSPGVLAKAFERNPDGNSHQGLGLILCRELVERNGGRMYAESEEGKGSTFYFTLPGRSNGAL